MRKFALVVAVLMLAAPAMAGVTVSATQVGDTNVVEVSYQVDQGDSNLPRAFALEVSLSVSNDSNIAPYDYNPEFYVAPGTYTYNAGTGEVNWGDPTVAATPSSVIVEMGSLYAAEDPCHTTPPDSNGSLFKFFVDHSCTVGLAENAERGGVDSNGVVMEDTEQSFPPGYATLIGCDVWIYPPCWDYISQCHADSDDTASVSTGDLTLLMDAWLKNYDVHEHWYGYRGDLVADRPGKYNPCIDADHNGSISTGDLTQLMNNWLYNVGHVDPNKELAVDCPTLYPDPKGDWEGVIY